MTITNKSKFDIVYYDYNKKAWELDDYTYVVDTWTTRKLANYINQPKVKLFVVEKEYEDEYQITTFGVSIKDYDNYVE